MSVIVPTLPPSSNALPPVPVEDREVVLQRIRAEMVATKERLAAAQKRKRSRPVKVEVPQSKGSSSLTPTSIPAAATAKTSSTITSTTEETTTGARRLSIAGAQRMNPVIPKITPPAIVTSTPPAASAASNGAADSPRSSLRMGTRGPAEPGGAERKFRSLADLQQAIKDGEQKKEEIVTQTKNQRQQRQEKLAAVAQPVDPNNPAAAGTRARTATRTQRRPTISIPTANASKITQQLGQFVSMLQALEGEFAKAEEQRIKKDEELSKMRGVMLRGEQQLEVNSDSLERIISSIVELAMKMDSFSAKLVEVTKKDPKGNTLTNEYTSIKEHLDRIKATTTKTNEITKESLEASYASTRARRQTLIGRKASVAPLPTGLEPGGSAPNAPTSPRAPPPPPTFKAAVARANPVTALLTQIQGGTQLKKVDKESDAGPGNKNWRKSVNLLKSLQDTLAAALEQRREDIEDEDDEEGEDPWADFDD